GVRCRRGVECRPHPLADLPVPRALILVDLDVCELPKIELGDVRAGTIAARDEGGALVLNDLERRYNVPAAVDAGGVALRADQDEVVVHNWVPLYAESFGEEFFLSWLCVHKYDIGITAPSGIKCLAGPLCDHLHINSGLRFEQRQYVSEQARVFRRGG